MKLEQVLKNFENKKDLENIDSHIYVNQSYVRLKIPMTEPKIFIFQTSLKQNRLLFLFCSAFFRILW